MTAPTPEPTAPVTDSAMDTSTDPQFSLDEARRLASLDAAKSITANNIQEFLDNATRVEEFLKGKSETPVDPPPTDPPVSPPPLI